MVDACTYTVPQNVTNSSFNFHGKFFTSNSEFQSGFQPSGQTQGHASSAMINQCSVHTHVEDISRNCDSAYVHSNIIHRTDSIPFMRSCLNMRGCDAFQNVNNSNPNRLFNSQLLTSYPPGIPEVESDISHDEEVHRPSCCFCNICAPVMSKSHCSNICCSKFNCFISTVSHCSPEAFLCLLFTGPCNCRLFSLPRHRVTNENLIILSIIQLLCGFAAIVLSSVAFTKAVFLHQMATGLWAGILMVMTGFHGLLAARRPVVCALVGLLVLCMIVSLSACVLICVSVAGTIEDGFLSSSTTQKGFPREITKISSSTHKNKTTFQQRYSKSLTTMTTKTADWSDVDQAQILEFKNVLRETSDTYLRTCQIILHLLLLLVGILEASVSLATSILCCRCVCSNSGNFRFQNSRSLRTNIVSFNAATANQAASVLRSGAINDFVGSGNVLLAVNADMPTRNDSVSTAELSLKPKIHHTLIPFLSELNRHSLILTQAGTGTVALSAARAAANLLDTRSCENQDRTSVPCTSTNEQSFTQRHFPLSRFIIHRLKGFRSSRPNESRPRLLYTTLQIPTDVSNASNSSPTSPFTSTSTIVYVMPSPTQEEPPMIFPPFPPSYNESQKKFGLVSNIGRVQRNHCTAFQSNQSRRYRRRLAGVSRPRFHSSVRSRFSRLLCRYTSHRSNLLHTTSASRHPRMQCHLSGSVASAPISVVGILEASVSLATSILCCRCVCSNSGNFRFQNSRSLRTNIVSFNAATANQAASVLRSGAINDFVGSGNVLLAVNADMPTRNDSVSTAELSLKPKIHHTLIPFLSELNRHSLILTQAGTGTVALSAARAAANLLDTRSCENQDRTSVPCTSTNEQSFTQRHFPLSRFIIHRLKGFRSSRPNESRPRLLYTTLQIPTDVSNASNSSPTSPFTSTSTIVYVMPSPTQEEPPMIFPPFPPSYNESQKKFGLVSNIGRVQRNHCTAFQSNQSRRYRRRLAGVSRPRFHSSVRSRFSRLLCRYTSHRSNLLHTTSASRHPRMQCHLSGSVASAPISVGDRLIQPVLIVGDPLTVGLKEDPPPKYSR
ncbi:hypothetical protein MN116_002031 [Schistosoma mekongi]|uniref:Uncharacterized protein n=1 Tax=Schistosoma mekongi TaxID=38744 RepID=A0AAE2D8A0_SCHME|nr:hypothetical protein MN116_002031 [Schistosoma mekongi]